MTWHGVPVTGMEPGSPEWMRRMSASKVAAVLGLSPWESPFSLWHRMAGNVPPVEQSDAMSRGHYLEGAVMKWWEHEHGVDLGLYVGGDTDTFAHPERPWQIARPDGTLFDHGFNKEPDPVAVLEVKTASDGTEWGAAGTDEIPPYYRAQCVWQMDVCGVDTCHVAVLLPYLEFRAYVVRYDPNEAAFIRERAWSFMQSLERGEAPAIDGHSATYEAVRELHPQINGDDVDVPYELAHGWVTSKRRATEAQLVESEYRNRLIAHMGDAQAATFAGQTIARRQAKNGGTPYLVAARNLPTFEETA